MITPPIGWMAPYSRRTLAEAIARSGLDLSPCGMCGGLTVCIPDGLCMCEACADAEAKRPPDRLDTLISGALAHQRNQALAAPCERLSPEVVARIIGNAERVAP